MLRKSYIAQYHMYFYLARSIAEQQMINRGKFN